MAKKVNLLIVGAMKAGTTSFNNMLAQHPNIYFSPIKEPNFFVNNLPKTIYSPSRFFNIETYFKKDFPNNLHIANIKTKEHYQKLFSLTNSNKKYLAEGSTAYLHAPESARLIHNYNPNAKIIILLRNPLKRAYSHYKMDLGLGRTTKKFDDLIKIDIQNYENKKLSNWSYLGMSLYKENIKRYLDLFKKNVLILHFEDLISNRNNTLNKVFDFLEVDKIDLEMPHSNPSTSLRFQKTLYFLKQLGLKDFFSLLVPKSIRHRIFKKLSKKEVTKIKLQEKAQNKIDSIFNLDLNNLKNIIPSFNYVNK